MEPRINIPQCKENFILLGFIYINLAAFSRSSGVSISTPI